MWNCECPEEYQLLCQLGKGSYGTVYKALHKKTARLVALKRLPVSELGSFTKEALKGLSCPQIVKILDSKADSDALWLATQYCACGSFLDVMRATEEEQEIAEVALSVLHALAYLHASKRIHRDIKAGNILLNQEGRVKLADFGVCKTLEGDQGRGTQVGTPYWMSPEILLGLDYSYNVDIWSLGITCIELAEGAPPFSHIHPNRAIFHIKKTPAKGLTNPSRWTPEFNHFVSLCLTRQPELRPDATTLLEHEFVKSSRQPKILLQLFHKSIDAVEKYFCAEEAGLVDLRLGSLSSEECSISGSVILKSEGQAKQLSRGTVSANHTLQQNSVVEVKDSSVAKPAFMNYFQQRVPEVPELSSIDQSIEDTIREFEEQIAELRERAVAKVDSWLALVELTYGKEERRARESAKARLSRPELDLAWTPKKGRIVESRGSDFKLNARNQQQFLQDPTLMEYIKRNYIPNK